MNNFFFEKLNSIKKRFLDINDLLNDANITNNIEKLTSLSKEQAKLKPIYDKFESYLKIKENQQQAKEYLYSKDKDIKQLAIEEVASTKEQLDKLELELKKLLIPKDDNDDDNTYLEIRAGTGGDESGIFVGNLFKMYSRYAENQGWQIEVINSYISESGGFKEIIILITGKSVYSKLKYESGTHRVQRVPETESQGRIHTSVCTVAVLPAVEGINNIDIDINDIRIDTFRASGAGGQHVNKTDSAIRLTHIPTGIVVECQEGRSQHKNKEKALSVLATKILDIQKQKQKLAIDKERKTQVGSGDRSERIRTYNYPQNRVTDHRIKLTLYKLEELLQGYLDFVINPLALDNQAKKLADFEKEITNK